VTADQCRDQLSRVQDFAGISRAEFDDLIEHMARERWLLDIRGELSLGEESERVFGRKNFMELYAVFSSPQLYTVVTHSDRPVGSLEQGFVDRIVEGVSCFLLGGRAWVAEAIHHLERKIVVSSAPRGRKPTWGGFIPQFLGHDVCRKMADILSSDAQLPYLDAAASAALVEARRDLGPLLAGRRWADVRDDESQVIWTFAGGAVNLTLKYGLQLLRGWTVTSDNFRLRLPYGQTTSGTLNDAMMQLGDSSFWQAPSLRTRILDALPEYRLSKFQQVLPSKWALEVVERYLMDVSRTVRYLST
jgi:ATP-dependent Lhr-like helicase